MKRTAREDRRAIERVVGKMLLIAATSAAASIMAGAIFDNVVDITRAMQVGALAASFSAPWIR